MKLKNPLFAGLLGNKLPLGGLSNFGVVKVSGFLEATFSSPMHSDRAFNPCCSCCKQLPNPSACFVTVLYFFSGVGIGGSLYSTSSELLDTQVVDVLESACNALALALFAMMPVISIDTLPRAPYCCLIIDL